MDNAENLFETVANYTYDWETWFSENGKVQWINPAVERMTGYSIAECLAMEDYPASLTHEEDRRKIIDLLTSARSGSSGNDVEFRILRKDRSTGWAAVSWQPVHDKRGGVLGFRTSVRDITERKRAEESLKRAKAEAERANSAKTRFLAAVSHDLRQPLQAISMYLAALKRANDDTRPAIWQHMELCLNNCNELLDDLVDISRLDANVVVPQIRSAAIADILETLERSMRSSAEKEALDLRVVSCSQFVLSDPAVLTRILQNLVSNAIRYTKTGRVLVGCRRRANRLEVQVWDTGIGISRDELDHVFEEFYQIGNLQRDRRRGVGLGLAIVRRLVDLLDADLRVRSTLGQGSVFSILVPIGDPASEVPAAARAASPLLMLEGTRIVVIDDEPSQLRAITLMLSAHGATVVAAADAAGVIGDLEKSGETPDLIIADYRLGEGATGAQALEQIQGWLQRTVPGIILTGDTEPQRISEAKASGYRLLHKPIHADKLVAEIQALRAATV